MRYTVAEAVSHIVPHCDSPVDLYTVKVVGIIGCA